MKKNRPNPVSTRRNPAGLAASGASDSPPISVTPSTTNTGKGKMDNIQDISKRDTLKKGLATDSEDSEKGKCASPAQVGADKAFSVGKLAPDSYKAFGSCSRSSSDTDSDLETVYCKGGPEKQSCGDPVINGGPGVQCDTCDSWYHPACQSVSVDAYQALKDHPILSWLCHDCKALLEKKTKTGLIPFRESVGLASKMDKIEAAFNDSLAKIEKSLQVQSEVVEKHHKAVETTMKELSLEKKSYTEIVKGNCDQVLAKVSEKIDTLPKPSVPTSSAIDKTTAHEISGIFDSFMDKEKRKFNVVVHNLQESVGTYTEQAEEDAAMVRRIIKEELKLVVRTTKAYRVGKKREDRPRLLIVTFENMDMKTEVLKQSRRLKDSTEWNNLYLTPDLTWSQREDLRKVREELARRRESGEENLVIRNFRIIKLNTDRPAGGGAAPQAAATAQPPEAARPSGSSATLPTAQAHSTRSAGEGASQTSSAHAQPTQDGQSTSIPAAGPSNTSQPSAGAISDGDNRSGDSRTTPSARNPAGIPPQAGRANSEGGGEEREPSSH